MIDAINKAKEAMGTRVDIMVPLNVVPPDRMRPTAKKVLLCPSVYESMVRHSKMADLENGEKTITGTIEILRGVPAEEREINELGYVIWSITTDGLSEEDLEQVDAHRVYLDTAPR